MWSASIKPGTILDVTDEIKRRTPLRWVLSALALLLVLVALIAACAWAFRVNLAEAYTARYCDQKGLVCEVEIERIGLNTAEIASLDISSNNQDALTTGNIRVNYAWPAFLSPKIGSIAIADPVLRAGFDGSKLDLRGLDQLASGEGGGDPVSIAVKSGRVILETPAGQLMGDVSMSGALPRSGEAQIDVAPAQLQSGDNRLSWTKGEAALTIADGRVTGTADIQIDEAVLGELTLESTELRATLGGTANAPVIQWRGSIENLELDSQSLSSVSTHGEALLSELPAGGMSSAFQTLNEVAGEVSAESVNSGGVSTGAINVTLDLVRGERLITGPIAVTADTFSTEMGLAEAVGVTGELELDPEDIGVLTFSGGVILEGASIDPQRRRSWLEVVGLPEPFKAHGDALNAALDQALAGFDIGGDVKFSRNGDRWQLDASRPTALRAQTGMTISVEPSVAPIWFSLSNGGLSMSGDVIVSGGGAPNLRALIMSGETSPGRFSIDAERFELRSWTEQGRKLDVSLRPLRLLAEDQRLRVSARGDVAISGTFPGAALEETILSGGFEATRGAEGWRVQTGQNACLDLKTEGMSSGGISLMPVAFEICPEDGRFVRQENGIPTGRLSLGDVRLPFEMGNTRGELDLVDSVVEWKLETALQTELTSKTLSMPLKIGSRELAIKGETPFLRLETGEGAFRFSSRLGLSTISGDLIPANVTSGGFSFSGSVPESGLIGRIRSSDVRIEDFREDPIYAPMVADLTATLKDGRIALSGPLTLQRSGWTIAEAEMDLGLSDLSGTAKLVGRELQFEPDGLQPYDLSDLLRPILPNARGMLRANADFTITRGKLAGTGNVSFDGLSFDTFRLGAIRGVSGSVDFEDVFALTTLPDQIVSVEMIDSGVPLRSGRIAFQLLEGRVLELQGARWPFAGGELFVEPTRWQLGGDTELVTINAEKIELAQLVQALALEKEFRAEGTVSGSFPLEIIGPNAFIRGAVLKADEKGGKLAYVGNSLDALTGRNDVTDYAVEALQDFRFKVFEVGANGNVSGDIDVSIGLEGQNPDVLEGTEIRFNVAIASKLAQLLRSAQSAATGAYITSIISEQVAAERAED